MARTSFPYLYSTVYTRPPTMITPVPWRTGLGQIQVRPKPGTPNSVTNPRSMPLVDVCVHSVMSAGGNRMPTKCAFRGFVGHRPGIDPLREFVLVKMALVPSQDQECYPRGSKRVLDAMPRVFLRLGWGSIGERRQ